MTQEKPAHSPLGPSQAERWMECPPSVKACENLPDTPKEYAAEGSAAHLVSEWCRRENKHAKFYRGRKIEIEGFTFEVNQEMIDGVQAFVDWCNDLDEGFTGDPYDDTYDGYFEERVEYERWVPGGFGTSDDIRIRDGSCVVTDLKYGKGVQVWAKDNPQLKLYALGVYEKFKHLYVFHKIVLRVCQPRLDHFDTWETTIEDLVEWADEKVVPAAWKALAGEGEFKAGSHCTFCKLKYDCAERTRWALNQVACSDKEFDDLDAVIEEVKLLPWVAELTREQLDKALSVLDLVTKWAKDMKSFAMSELQQGREIGDWKLVAGRSRRYWTVSEDEVVDSLVEEGGLDETQIYERKLLTPPKAEKLIGKKHPLMKAIVDKGPGKPKLAPGSDPRPAMSIDALKEFTDLDADSEKDDDE